MKKKNSKDKKKENFKQTRTDTNNENRHESLIGGATKCYFLKVNKTRHLETSSIIY